MAWSENLKPLTLALTKLSRGADVEGAHSLPKGIPVVKAPSGRVTIQHVADEAGVSIATVSRVVNGDSKVSKSLAEKVSATAQRLGYRPFAAARDLASGNHRSIGVIVPDLGNPYFYDVIKATSVGAAHDGYRMLISDTGDDPDAELSIIQERLSQVDGLLVLSSRVDAKQLEALSGQPTPVVLVNRIVQGGSLPVVAVDNFSAMLEICHHLVTLGHKKVVYLSGAEHGWQNAERWRAVVQAKVMGLESQRLMSSPTIEGGYQSADAALELGPTAIICFNDLVACGVLTRLRERGVRVPEDISVTGFDDIEFSRHTLPALTTAVSPRAELGRAAWAMLSEALAAHEPEEQELLKADVVYRDSTGPAAVHK